MPIVNLTKRTTNEVTTTPTLHASRKVAKVITIVNLTSHTINEITTETTFPASGRVVRVKDNTVKVGSYNGCPIYQSTFGDVEGLPEPVKGTIYIVSALALNGVPKNRVDVMSPGNLCRDENGKPVGCMGFRARN